MFDRCHVLLRISSCNPSATGNEASVTRSYKNPEKVSHHPVSILRLIPAMISQLQKVKQFQQKRLGMPHRRSLASPGLGKCREPDPHEASGWICKQVPLLTPTALSPGLGL